MITLIKKMNLGRHKVLVGFILVFLLFELSVRTEYFWNISPASQSQELKTVPTMSLGGTEPEIVIFGNSIMRNAVSPVVLAESLDLDQSKVANLSVSGGYPMDYEFQFDTYFQSSKNLKLVVIGVDHRAFDSGGSHPVRPHKFRRVASLDQRLMLARTYDRIDTAMGWIWRTWDSRFQASSYVRELFETGHIDGSDPQVDELGRIGVRPPTNLTSPEEITELANLAAANYTHFDGINMVAFRKLMNVLDERDIGILLVRAPMTDIFYSVILETAENEIEKHSQAVVGAANRPLDVIVMDDLICRIVEECYTDYGHMNQQGATEYSKALALHIKSLGFY